jgi:PDZ domain-containing protein
MIRRVSPRRYFFAALLLLVALFAPLPFVLVEPGTPDDTFGKVKGKQVLEILGRESYPTTGKLNLTSIWVTNPESRLHSFELIRAWVDGERSVQPREAFYPKGEDPKEVRKESVADMKNSQLSSTIAALNHLKIPFAEQLVIKGFTENSLNKSSVKKEDKIISFNGEKITSSTQLRELILNTKDKSIDLGVIRNEKELLIPVRVQTVQSNGSKQNMIGILVSEDYEFPFTVKIRLKNVGGPSAGLIFALAIIDKLTKEDLVRGRNIAGTGTISPSGKVGPIGGIEEKLIGAAREGATLFFAPSLNCPDIRHTPKGLRVVAVDDLDEAIAALRATDPETLPMCG